MTKEQRENIILVISMMTRVERIHRASRLINFIIPGMKSMGDCSPEALADAQHELKLLTNSLKQDKPCL